jgi:hypothetical protein
MHLVVQPGTFIDFAICPLENSSTFKPVFNEISFVRGRIGQLKKSFALSKTVLKISYEFRAIWVSLRTLTMIKIVLPKPFVSDLIRLNNFSKSMQNIINPLAYAHGAICSTVRPMSTSLIIFPVSQVVRVISKNDSTEAFSLTLLIKRTCV